MPHPLGKYVIESRSGYTVNQHIPCYMVIIVPQRQSAVTCYQLMYVSIRHPLVTVYKCCCSLGHCLAHTPSYTFWWVFINVRSLLLPHPSWLLKTCRDNQEARKHGVFLVCPISDFSAQVIQYGDSES